MNKKVILFGAGKTGNRVLSKIKNEREFLGDDYFVADNNADLWGDRLDDICIIDPSELSAMEFDYVIICAKAEDEIKHQLIKEIGVPEYKIFNLEEYRRQSFCESVYLEREEQYSDISTGTLSGTERIVVYTAITGGYDELKAPEVQDENITYVCFTDDPDKKSDIWNIEYVKSDEGAMMQAKMFKLHPERYFKDFEVSVWVDGAYAIRDDLRDYIRIYSKGSPLLCFPHFERRCIYDEALECINCGKASKEQMVRQMSYYCSQNYPFDNGLYEMGCIARQHNNSKVIRLMDEWEKQIRTFSTRDQISFPYVSFKENFCPDICNLYIANNKWLKHYNHRM
ncbi:glycosyltransferase domain-containing protein [Butyrivibrio sp. MB2005]|uniref:glycosyltransferase domain-containing protein n=1 Tax=Butyrivibrio sp. MB2005 TaxID=1280678 RepID=UPI0004053487|nr:glycosyltransferase domain-containing protein [Butyrivibrio sp. MB2005]